MSVLKYLQERAFTNGFTAIFVNSDLEPFAHKTASPSENHSDFVRKVIRVALEEPAAGIFLLETRSGSNHPSRAAKSVASSLAYALAETETHFLDLLTFDGAELCSTFARAGKAEVDLLWPRVPGH